MFTRFLLSICSLITVGCADLNSKDSARRDWSLQPPLYYSPKTGTSIGFDQFTERGLTQLHLDDVIYFKEGPRSNVKLNVKTVCSLNSQKHSAQLSLTLPDQVSVFQLLPPKVWLVDHFETVCSLQFFVASPTGDLHVFDIANVPLDNQPSKADLQLSRYSNSSTIVTRVYLDRLGDYFFNSKADRSYDLTCLDVTASAYGGQNITNLAEFSGTDWQSLITDSSICRLIEKDLYGLILRFSEVFRIFPFEPMLEVNIRTTERLRFDYLRSKIPLQNWELSNHSDSPLNIALPNIEKYSFPMEAAFTALKPVVYDLSSSGAWNRGQKIHDHFVFSIPPRSTVPLSIVSSQLLACRNSVPHGIWALAPSEDPIAIKIIRDAKRPIDAKNTSAEILIPFTGRRWVGRSVGPQTLPNQDKTLQDDYSTLPIHGKKAAGRICNWR